MTTNREVPDETCANAQSDQGLHIWHKSPFLWWGFIYPFCIALYTGNLTSCKSTLQDQEESELKFPISVKLSTLEKKLMTLTRRKETVGAYANTKTKIRLRICAVWSGTLVFANTQHTKVCKRTAKGSDQSLGFSREICVFVIFFMARFSLSFNASLTRQCSEVVVYCRNVVDRRVNNAKEKVFILMQRFM